MFSGGTYEEVGRWLWNTLASHAKRENPRAEVLLDARGEGGDRSYGIRLRLGSRVSPPWEFRYEDVASNRGNLGWCRALADQARAEVRKLGSAPGVVVGPRG